MLRQLIGTLGSENESNRIAWTKEQLAAIPAGARILDAGAGTQRFRSYCDHLVYVSQDFAAYDPKANPDGMHTESWDYKDIDIVSDICAIPRPDASFDAILCTEVLEHTPEPEKAIRELARLLKPGGRLILTVPFCSLTHMAPYHFSTGFSKYWIDRHLSANGLSRITTEHNGDWFSYIAQELRRSPQVVAKFRGRGPGIFFRIAMGLALLALTLTRRDRRLGESSSLLCYGLHVVAFRD